MTVATNTSRIQTKKVLPMTEETVEWMRKPKPTNQKRDQNPKTIQPMPKKDQAEATKDQAKATKAM